MVAQRKTSRKTRRKTRAKSSATIEQMAWEIPSYLDAPTEPVTEEIVEKIHQTSLKILEEIGILFLNSEAREVLKNLGCSVDEASQNVRFDKEIVEDALTKAPSEF